jgi:hypothetical protein
MHRSHDRFSQWRSVRKLPEIGGFHHHYERMTA